MQSKLKKAKRAAKVGIKATKILLVVSKVTSPKTVAKLAVKTAAKVAVARLRNRVYR